MPVFVRALFIKSSTEVELSYCTKKISDNIQLIEIPQLSTPALVGFKNPKIIIPSNVPEYDLYYILLHELEHYKHHDLYFIAILHLLCIIYWWNPVIYLLKHAALKVIEYRIDNAVAQQLSEQGKLNYLQSIIDIIQLKNRSNVKASFGIGLYEKNPICTNVSV